MANVTLRTYLVLAAIPIFQTAPTLVQIATGSAWRYKIGMGAYPVRKATTRAMEKKVTRRYFPGSADMCEAHDALIQREASHRLAALSDAILDLELTHRRRPGDSGKTKDPWGDPVRHLSLHQAFLNA